MIDTTTLKLFKARYNALTTDGKSPTSVDSMRGLTLGLVVGTDDPLQSGRLQIFCPAYNDSPKKVQQLPWAMYIMPFGGSIDNSLYARGVEDGEEYTQGAVHYGSWGIPELGAHVLVGCVDGDPRRRFWLGCIPEHQEVHTLLTGRFDWSSKDGTPDGPLSSTKGKIQPLYDNLAKAFVDKKSREWKSRGADFQISAIPKNGQGFPSKSKGANYLDETYEEMSKHEEDVWVRDILGAHGYDWTAFRNMSGMKSSRVYGMSTPGLHSMSMDDRPFNSRMKFRTATGHMFLLDDTNERIYLMTNKGNNWIEMDSNGNIDIFSGNRISINGTKDINFTTQGTIRMHAATGIHMYSGHANTDDDAPTLDSPPTSGEIRIQSENDFHMSSRNIRIKSIENTYNEIGINQYNTVGDSSFTDVTRDINLQTLTGDYISTINGSLLETVKTNSKRFTEGTSAVSSRGNAEYHSFEGTMTVGAAMDTTIKTANGNIDMEASGLNNDTGNVRVNTPSSQLTIGDDGLQGLTKGDSLFKSGKSYQVEITTEAGNKPASKTTAPLKFEGVPAPSDCNVGTLPKVNKTGKLTTKEVAQVCYNAGFRGQDLVIATAVAFAESSNNSTAFNKGGAGVSNGVKYTGACGLFQIREMSAADLPNYQGTIDGLRDNRNHQLDNPNTNAKIAYQIFSKMGPKNKWSVGKWESLNGSNGKFEQAIPAAAVAVSELCGGVPMGFADFPELDEPFGISVDEDYVEDDTVEDDGEELMYASAIPSSNTLLHMSLTGMTLQSATTVDFKDMATGMFNSHSEMTTRINSNTAGINMLSYYTALLQPAISTLASSLNKSFSMPFSFDMGSITSKLYDSVVPQELKNAYSSLQQLNTQIQALGNLGLQTPLTPENFVSQLNGNVAALQALGLPIDMNFSVNPGIFTGLQTIEQLTKIVESDIVEMLQIPDMRKLVQNVYVKGSQQLGMNPITQSEIDDILGI